MSSKLSDLPKSRNGYWNDLANPAKQYQDKFPHSAVVVNETVPEKLPTQKENYQMVPGAMQVIRQQHIDAGTKKLYQTNQTTRQPDGSNC